MDYYSKKLITLVIYLICQLNYISAQTFTSLGGGLDPNNAQVYGIYYDTTTNILYAGGLMSVTGQGIPVSGIAQWNGVQWDSVGRGVTGLGTVICFDKYQNDIIVAGSFSSMGFANTNGIAKWNGSNYSALVNINGGAVDKVKVIGNSLYIGGPFYLLNGIPAYGFAKYDGVSWTIYPALNTTPTISAIEEFNGELYVGGIISVPGSAPPIYAMAKWNGTQWVKVGSGFGNPNHYVAAMTIYQNELYAAGSFSLAGSPGYNIAKWNGSTWSQCGSGIVSGYLRCMIEYNNELYVGGIFTNAGGVQVSCFAKWDGSQWYNIPGGSLSMPGGLATFTKSNTDLYLAGKFDLLSGLPFHNIAKFNSPVSVKNDFITDFPVTVHPTIATDLIKFSYNSIIQMQGDIRIYNSDGKEVYYSCHMPLNYVEIDIKKFPKGIYHLKAISKEGFGTVKFIKM